MKKILSLMSAFGLTATAGTSLVACGTQKKAEFKFQSLASITNQVWKKDEFGVFLKSDFEQKNNRWIVKNKQKLAAYFGAHFSNFSTAYNKISGEGVTATLFKTNPNSGQPNANAEDLQKSFPEDGKMSDIFFLKLTDQTKSESPYLQILFANKTSDSTADIFDVKTWMENNPNLSIKVQELKERDNSEEFEKDFAQIVELQKQIANLKPNENNSNWVLADQALNKTLNVVWKYLVRIEFLQVNYNNSQTAPLTIKKQFQDYVKADKKLENEIRQQILASWKTTDLNQSPLKIVLPHPSEDKKTTLELNFTETIQN